MALIHNNQKNLDNDLGKSIKVFEEIKKSFSEEGLVGKNLILDGWSKDQLEIEKLLKKIIFIIEEIRIDL